MLGPRPLKPAHTPEWMKARRQIESKPTKVQAGHDIQMLKPESSQQHEHMW